MEGGPVKGGRVWKGTSEERACMEGGPVKRGRVWKVDQ